MSEQPQCQFCWETNEELSRLTRERDALQATVERCRADAERYRFLRRTMYHEESFDIGESYLKWKVVGACPETHEWDAAIDAARKEAECAKGGGDA